MLLVVFVCNASVIKIPLPRTGQGSWDMWSHSILRLIYSSKGDRVSWFLIYLGREGSSQALRILQRQRVGREETQSRFNSLVNYNLPRGAPSTPPSSSISQKRGAWNTRRPQAARLFLSRQTSGCTFGGKCGLGGGTCSLGSYLLPSTLCLFMQVPTFTCLPLLCPRLPGQGLCRGIQNEELARSSLPLGLPGGQHSSSLLLIRPHKEPLWPLRAWSTPSESCTQRSKGSALIATVQEHEAMREWTRKRV